MGIGYKDPAEDVPASQLTRIFPSTHGISHKRRKRIERIVQEYMRYNKKIHLATDVVGDMVRSLSLRIKRTDDKGKEIKESRFVEEFHPKKNYFKVNEEGTSFAVVKHGSEFSLRHGVRFLFAHNDSPGLITKSRPELFEWDPDLKEQYTGARLDMLAYGGIHVYQWLGKDVYLTGWTIKPNLKRKILKIGTGYIPDKSVHTLSAARNEKAELEDAFPPEHVDVICGNESVKAMRKHFGLKSDLDWGNSRIFAVPYNTPRLMANNFIVGYGHDCRICVFAGKKAIFTTNPKHTCIYFGFDKEEVGSKGLSGAVGPFFEEVIEELVDNEPKEYWPKPKMGLTRRVRQMIKNSWGINADVDIGSTYPEISDNDPWNMARLGYGPFINAQDGICDDDQISPIVVRFMRNIAERRYTPRTKTKIRAQITGSPHKAGYTDGEHTNRVCFSNRGIRTADVGVPVGCLHSPRELAHGGDLDGTIDFYTEFFNSATPDPTFLKKNGK